MADETTKKMVDPFHVRFNIDVSFEEAQRRFINRIANRVLGLVTQFFDFSRGKSSGLDNMMIEVETELGEPHSNYISSPSVFMEVWQKRIDGNFSRCLIAIEGLFHGVTKWFPAVGILSVKEAVTSTLNQSEIDLGITWRDGVFLRKGAELLDEKLVNEPLHWLTDPKYETVLTPFKKGLSHLLEGTQDSQRLGDAVTDMYEALEAMSKITTGKPTRDLSSLREEFVAKLRLPAAYKTILKEYIDYGCDFRHAMQTGQQRTWPLENEAEAFVYLTGLIIRLAIQAEKETS